MNYLSLDDLMRAKIAFIKYMACEEYQALTRDVKRSYEDQLQQIINEINKRQTNR